jgi:hypothetical protein
MGSTRKFSKQVGHNASVSDYRERTLTCGCKTEKPPTTSNPEKWFCCGEYRKAKR